MRRLKFRINRKSLETVYFRFFRPLLEYAHVIWDNYTYYEKLELDKIQTEAARIVLGTFGRKWLRIWRSLIRAFVGRLNIL